MKRSSTGPEPNTLSPTRSEFDLPPSLSYSTLLVATNDTSRSFRCIRVRGHAFLLPRLVLDTPNAVRWGGDERPDHHSGSYIHRKPLQNLLTHEFVASVVAVGVIWVLFAGVTRVGAVVVQRLPRSVYRIDACTSKIFAISMPLFAHRAILHCPPLQEIQEAKNDLRAKGVTVD